MTGLDADTDHILEMACLITDSELNLIAEVIFAIFTISIFAYEPQHEKKLFSELPSRSNRGLTQTGRYSHRRSLEA